MKTVSVSLLIEALAARWNSDATPEMELVVDFIAEYAKESGFDIPLKTVLSHYDAEPDLFNPKADTPLTPGQYEALYKEDAPSAFEWEPFIKLNEFNELGSNVIPPVPRLAPANSIRAAEYTRKEVADMLQTDWVHVAADGVMRSYAPEYKGDSATLLTGTFKDGKLFVETKLTGNAALKAAAVYLLNLVEGQ